MTKEELLQPRVKIIALWPYSPRHVKVGDIVTGDKAITLSRYSANCKELKWWEDRKVEDMPDYVAFGDSKGGHLVKVLKWHPEGFDYEENGIRKYNLLGITQPATEEEYNEYQKRLKQPV